ncbi:MAG: hypothetical protein M3132_13290, partial [Actinomycetia bacterium]|nr:hypothetical protein [Actinomycetes bacterium]
EHAPSVVAHHDVGGAVVEHEEVEITIIVVVAPNAPMGADVVVQSAAGDVGPGSVAIIEADAALATVVGDVQIEQVIAIDVDPAHRARGAIVVDRRQSHIYELSERGIRPEQGKNQAQSGPGEACGEHMGPSKMRGTMGIIPLRPR